MSKFYQCLYCKNSYLSDKKRKNHEEVCVKNGKTGQQRFEAIKKLKSTKTK